MSEQEQESTLPSALTKVSGGNGSDSGVTGCGALLAVVIFGLLIWGFVSCSKPRPPQVDEGEPAAATKAEPAPPAPRARSDDGYSDTAVKAAAIQAVKRRLLDDRSAHFRNVIMVPSEIGTKAVCGEVNSKNRAGGYAGYQRFISAGVDKYTWLEEDMPDFGGAWNEVCVR